MARVDAIIRWFMPKEERFHELLARDTAEPRRGGPALRRDRGQHQPGRPAAPRDRAKAIEHEGDIITREIFDALNSTFITPFDREDIRALATDLDDILDYMEGVAQHLVLFELGDRRRGCGVRRHPGRRWRRRSTRVTAPDLGPRQRAGDPRVHRPDLRAGERGRPPLQHGDRRPVPDERPRPPRDPEVEGDLRGLENACDQCKDYTHVIGNIVVKNS